MKKKPRIESRIPASERLVSALQQLNDPKLADMIKRARDGYYDDYKSPIPYPIILLATDLKIAGYPGMVERVKDGEWDAKPWEGREWWHREGRALLRKHFPPNRKGGYGDRGEDKDAGY